LATSKEGDKDVREYTIKILNLIDKFSHNGFTVTKRTTKSTVTVKKPQDNPSTQKSGPPLSGTFKVKCYGPDGKSGTTGDISVGSNIGSVMSAI